MNRFFVLTFVIAAAVIIVNCSEKKTSFNQNLAGHWKFDELSQDRKTTPDASGSNHHGYLHGQTLVEGVIGGAMNFEGYDQIVEVGDLKLKAPATVAFRIKTRDLIHDRRLFSQMEGAENQAGALRFDGIVMEVWDGSEWKVLIDRRMRINRWMHVAVVFEESGKTYGYLNGERQHLVRCGFDFSGVRASIGGKFLGKAGNIFTGQMDDFRIYSKALSEDEITRLYSLE